MCVCGVIFAAFPHRAAIVFCLFSAAAALVFGAGFLASCLFSKMRREDGFSLPCGAVLIAFSLALFFRPAVLAESVPLAAGLFLVARGAAKCNPAAKARGGSAFPVLIAIAAALFFTGLAVSLRLSAPLDVRTNFAGVCLTAAGAAEAVFGVCFAPHGKEKDSLFEKQK